MNPSEFTLSRHAITRLLERFPNVKAKWDNEKEAVYRLKLVYDLFYDSKEEKSIVNDTRFMTYLAEHYSGVKHCFFVLNDAVFVGVSNENGNRIVTVVRRSFYKSPQLRNG